VRLQHFVMKRFEHYTKHRCLASNYHLDTDNYHIDLWWAEHNEKGERYTPIEETIGIWQIARKIEIIERYKAEGFPCSKMQLKDAELALKMDTDKKPSEEYPDSPPTPFKCHWNTELGKDTDAEIQRVAASKGLAEKYAEIRKRWEVVAPARYAFDERASKLNTPDDPAIKLAAELTAIKSELANNKGNTAQLDKLQKRLEATELCLSAQMQQTEALKQANAELQEEKRRLTASIESHKAYNAKATSALASQAKAETELAAQTATVKALEKRVAELKIESAAHLKEARDIWDAGRAFELKWREEEAKRLALENRYEPKEVIEEEVVPDIVVERKPVAPAPAPEPSLRRRPSVDPTKVKWGGDVQQRGYYGPR